MTPEEEAYYEAWAEEQLLNPDMAPAIIALREFCDNIERLRAEGPNEADSALYEAKKREYDAEFVEDFKALKGRARPGMFDDGADLD